MPVGINLLYLCSKILRAAAAAERKHDFSSFITHEARVLALVHRSNAMETQAEHFADMGDGDCCCSALHLKNSLGVPGRGTDSSRFAKDSGQICRLDRECQCTGPPRHYHSTDSQQ